MNLQNLPCIIRLYICYNYIWRAYVTPGPGVCLVHHSQDSRQHSCLRVKQLGMGSGIGAKSTVLFFCLSKNGKPMKFPQSFGKSWGYTLIRPLPPRKRNRNLLCIYLFICLFICLYIYHIFLFISICIQSFGPMLPCESLPQCSQCCLSDVAHPGHGMVLGQSLGNSIFWILYKLAKCLNHKPQTQRITIRTWPAQRSACMI